MPRDVVPLLKPFFSAGDENFFRERGTFPPRVHAEEAPRSGEGARGARLPAQMSFAEIPDLVIHDRFRGACVFIQLDVGANNKIHEKF